MSLNDAITGMNAYFLDETNGFGETVYHIPGGVIEDKVELWAAAVDWDHEEGQNNVRGDGRAINVDKGRSVRKSVKIELPAGVVVAEDGKDLFQVMDPVLQSLVMVSVKRILGRDVAMQTVLAVRTTEHQAQAGRRLG